MLTASEARQLLDSIEHDTRIGLRDRAVIGYPRPNRKDSARLKAQIAEQDKLLVGLSRILIDPDIEPLAQKSIARQMAEAEGKREQLRSFGSGGGSRHRQFGDLLNDFRTAFLEAPQNFARLFTPSQSNRFIEEVAGPMLILSDSSVVQKNDDGTANGDARKESDDSLRARGIAGARYVTRRIVKVAFWGCFGRMA